LLLRRRIWRFFWSRYLFARLWCLRGLPVEVAGLADEAVEALAVVTLGALLELRVHVHRHLGVGVADLAHNPLDVEVVREQSDRDVGASEAVGSDVREWRAALGQQSLSRGCRGFAHDRVGASAREASAAKVGDEVGVRACEGSAAS
jgi:hypothetical protein